MNRLLFVDIESLPDGEPIDPLTLTPPAQMKKADTIAKWREEEAPALALELYRKRALDSMQGKIWCIAFSWDGCERVLQNDNEYEMLKEFDDIIREKIGKWKVMPTWVGWNNSQFDMPWLWRASIKYGLKSIKIAINRDKHRGNIVDLMEIWSAQFRDYRKLTDVADYLGIPRDKNAPDGSKVYELICNGEGELVKKHCMEDVLMCKEIYAKIYA